MHLRRASASVYRPENDEEKNKHVVEAKQKGRKAQSIYIHCLQNRQAGVGARRKGAQQNSDEEPRDLCTRSALANVAQRNSDEKPRDLCIHSLLAKRRLQPTTKCYANLVGRYLEERLLDQLPARGYSAARTRQHGGQGGGGGGGSTEISRSRQETIKGDGRMEAWKHACGHSPRQDRQKIQASDSHDRPSSLAGRRRNAYILQEQTANL